MGFSMQEYWSGLPLPSPTHTFIPSQFCKLGDQWAQRLPFSGSLKAKIKLSTSLSSHLQALGEIRYQVYSEPCFLTSCQPASPFRSWSLSPVLEHGPLPLRVSNSADSQVWGPADFLFCCYYSVSSQRKSSASGASVIRLDHTGQTKIIFPILRPATITSWEIDEETVETVSDFILGGSKITADGDCSHEIKRRLLLGRKVITNLDSILKSRDITLPTKVRLVKAMVYPVVMYGCESWTVKKAECQRIDAF